MSSRRPRAQTLIDEAAAREWKTPGDACGRPKCLAFPRKRTAKKKPPK